MTGRLIVGACVALLACGSTKRADRDAASEAGASAGGDGASAGEGGSGGSSAGGGAGGATLELSLDVVRRTTDSEWMPAARAHVRIEASSASLEELSDDDGHVVARVDADTGPWDVTVALADCYPISILGVTESLTGAVHLWCDSPPGAEPEQTRTITGAVVGRSWPGSVLSLSGPRRGGTPKWSVAGYSAMLRASGSASALRLLAAEWDSYDVDAAPLNAVWLDVPATGDAPVDIVLPTPARAVARTELVLELPSSGQVVGNDLRPPAWPVVSRLEDGYEHRVGRSSLEPSSDPNRYAWIVEAFTGDMAPNEASVELASAPGQDTKQQILIATDPSADDSVSIPPVEALHTSGTTLDDLTVSWSAPAYSHVGASIVAWDGSGAWYVYSFAGVESATRPWPRLPDGVSREEVGLGSDDFTVNVFAATQDGAPWDWPGNRNQQAVVVSTRLSPEPPLELSEPSRTGPLNAYDGIYSLTDVTRNASSCADEGPSVRDEYGEDYFVVVGLRSGLQVGSCFDPDACRALAATFWEDGGAGSEWLLAANFPQSAEGRVSIVSSGSNGALCTPWTLLTISATGVAGEHLRFALEKVDVPPHPRDDAGECTLELARAAAEGLDCTWREVRTGEFYEPL